MRRCSLLISFSFILASFNCLGQFNDTYELHRRIYTPSDILSADFDGDGLKDIVSSSTGDDQIVWLRNLGGDFAMQEIVSLGVDQPQSIDAFDVDGDGDMDIIAGSTTGDIVWLENNGSGVFSNPLIIGSVLTPSIFAQDLDNDGLEDIVVGSFSNAKIVWFRNLSGGVFGTEQIIATGTGAINDVFCSDLDNDGDAEVLFCTQNDKIVWIENFGGFFGTQILVSNTQVDVISISCADFDGDGFNDIVAASTGDGKVSWYQNTGINSFSTEINITSSATFVDAVAVGDMDSDGDIDVVTNEFYSGGSYVRTVWFDNTGSSFGSSTAITGNNRLDEITLEDFNGDGNLDVFGSTKGASHLVYCENLGAGSFGSDGLFPGYYFTVGERGQATDLDLDGDIDVVVIYTNSIYWYENLGNNEYSAISRVVGLNLLSGNSVREIQVADFDGDGDNDIAAAQYSNSNPSINKISWFKNDGNTVFTGPISINVSINQATSVDAADIDNDGDIDLVSGAASGVDWFKNDGLGNFIQQPTLSTLQFITHVLIYDVNGDGFGDVIASDRWTDKIILHYNQGGNSFGPEILISDQADQATYVNAADLDSDGLVDILSASRGDDKIAWYKNLGTSFGPEQIITTSALDAFYVRAEDFDLDGDPDILSAPLNGPLAWYENLGGTFGNAINISTGSLGGTAADVNDLDGDGDLDVLFFNTNGSSITWHKNFNISPFQAKGRIFVDVNQNGMYDSLESTIPMLAVLSNPVSNQTYSFSDGRYIFNFSDTLGSYSIYPQQLIYWGVTTNPTTFQINIDSTYQSQGGLDFGMFPDTVVNHVEPVLTGGFPRCNQLVNYWLNLENIGTTFPEGKFYVELDDSLQYVSSDLAPDSIVGQKIYWSYDTLDYFETVQANIVVQFPDFNSINDTVSSYLFVTVDSLDTAVYMNVDTLHQVVVCAYDPNDKLADPSGVTNLGYIWPAPPSIDYTIRFQNTGNDTALHVRIVDQLDLNLDWSSLDFIASSDPVSIEISKDGEVEFYFKKIFLPDSNTNEIESHGFIKYKIDLKENLPMGTQLFNTASIFFDQNPPIITNTVVHTLDTLAAQPNDLIEINAERKFIVYPNPFHNEITVRSYLETNENFKVVVYSISGAEVLRQESGKLSSLKINTDHLLSGVYILIGQDDANNFLFSKRIVRD